MYHDRFSIYACGRLPWHPRGPQHQAARAACLPISGQHDEGMRESYLPALPGSKCLQKPMREIAPPRLQPLDSAR